MRITRKVVGLAAVLALAAFLPAARAQSTAPPADYDPNFNYDCNRACLNGFLDQVIAASHKVPGAIWSLGKTLVDNAVRKSA